MDYVSGGPRIEPIAPTWQLMMQPILDSDDPIVITNNESWSGKKLYQHAGGGADFLDEHGAKKGTAVICLLVASPSSFALTIGASATDRPLAPLGPKLTFSELLPAVQNLETDFILTDPAYVDLAEQLAKATNHRVVVLDHDLPAVSRELPFDVPANRPAAILHTSGTSGIPKAVPYYQGPLAHRATTNGKLLELGRGCIYASSSPFHHIAGVGAFFVAVASGAALLSVPEFSIEAWKELGNRGVTHVQSVPTMMEKLLREDALFLPSLRFLQYGASPIHPDTLRAAMATLPNTRILQMYSQTEGGPITVLSPEDHVRALEGREDLLGTVGLPAPGVEIRIADPGEDGIGEVQARAAQYFKIAEDGWLHTGDLGKLTDEGYLILSGRKGDMIIRGGENVYPVEVELVIDTHEDVLESCVFGIKDKQWGEVVAAAIVASPGKTVNHEVLRAFTRERLAGFKIPTVWIDLPELPRNPTGKVLRRNLVADYSPTNLA